ncbi:GHKL domain-containing protein [Pedobacter sp. BS3]|uniref:sensor histidine kinase n=1 Tax=Pedobacter sp. BS3 TaxID=2567937 RepID=UPI0011F034D1|nr:HAMP domain-containing sensor histidine kinase [Pedobacter sp. BS3]TZF82109.1 GHKL domain-containing protein [Pedobacter sp. BS3]
MTRKPLLIFYFLICYALAELVWWGYLIIKVRPDRTGMILGEGAVFLFLFFIGAYQLQKALRKERKLHQQQRNFLLSVTHELKSPLASIKLYLQTILKRDLDESQRKGFLTNSLKDIERLDDLVENMLIASKIENKSYTFPKENFNFSEMVERVSERLQVHTCNTQTIKSKVEPGIMLCGDKFALTSVVTNLIENAVKYSPPCAQIEVKLYKSNDNVILEVADQGIGINDDEKLRIFDKFYRVGSENTRKTKGTGLGLFIVKQVLNNHQAQIKVKNNRPTGTIFEVIFNTNVSKTTHTTG